MPGSCEERVVPIMWFLVLFFAVYWLMHLTVFGVSAGQLGLSTRVWWMIVPMSLALSLTPLGAAVLPETLPRWILKPVWWLIYTWLGILFYLFCAQAGYVLLRRIAQWGPPSLQNFFAPRPIWFVALVLVVFSVVGYGVYEAKQRFHVTRLEIPVASLQRPLRLVFFSDLHLGLMPGFGRLEDLVRLCRLETPDGVLIAGDLLNDHIGFLDREKALMRELRTYAPVWAVLGNHEVYAGEAAALTWYQEAGVRVLSNTSALLTIDPRVRVTGVDDPAAGQGSLQQRLALALPQALDSPELHILLSHSPRGWPEAVPPDVDLMLSGHTHQGQMFPFSWVVKLAYPHIYGLYSRDEKRLLVSRGAGTWGPPFRVLAPPEAFVLEFIPHQDAGGADGKTSPSHGQ